MSDDRNEGRQTSPEAAKAASQVLRDGEQDEKSKKAAASALSQAGEGGQQKHTSDEAASAAANVLQDDAEDRNSKKAAGSALSQSDGGNKS